MTKAGLWKNSKSKFVNEILFEDKVLGTMSVYKDSGGGGWFVFSNNKDFQKVYPSGNVPVSPKQSEALRFAKIWMDKLSQGVKS